MDAQLWARISREAYERIQVAALARKTPPGHVVDGLVLEHLPHIDLSAYQNEGGKKC